MNSAIIPENLPRPLPLEEAQARLLALAEPLGMEHVAVDETLGRIMAEPLIARRTQPAADLSAMDGYAVRSGDGRADWRIVGESAAGHPYPGTVMPGEAVRIATGALVPAGADCVLLQEDCTRNKDRLTGEAATPSTKRHIRHEGSDFAIGATLLPAGARIGPAQMALAIAAGHTHLPVRRLPRIAIIDSGDELAPPGALCRPHQIPASNGAMLAALAASMPCHVTRRGPVADDLDRLAATLDEAVSAANDIIVTTGGASVGDHDLMHEALERIGARLSFWRVAIKPGKPLLVAHVERGPQRRIILGLPGNPVASLVTGMFFLLPLLRRLQGAADCLPRRISARALVPFPAGGSRREFRRGIWDGDGLRDGENHNSGALASLAACNCLIDRPADAPPAMAGDTITAWLLENGGMV